jgi:hypothetical protein
MYICGVETFILTFCSFVNQANETSCLAQNISETPLCTKPTPGHTYWLSWIFIVLALWSWVLNREAANINFIIHLLLPIIGLLQQFKDYVKGIAVEKDKQTKIISIRK